MGCAALALQHCATTSSSNATVARGPRPYMHHTTVAILFAALFCNFAVRRAAATGIDTPLPSSPLSTPTASVCPCTLVAGDTWHNRTDSTFRYGPEEGVTPSDDDQTSSQEVLCTSSNCSALMLTVGVGRVLSGVTVRTTFLPSVNLTCGGTLRDSAFFLDGGCVEGSEATVRIADSATLANVTISVVGFGRVTFERLGRTQRCVFMLGPTIGLFSFASTALSTDDTFVLNRITDIGSAGSGTTFSVQPAIYCVPRLGSASSAHRRFSAGHTAVDCWGRRHQHHNRCSGTNQLDSDHRRLYRTWRRNIGRQFL